MSGEIPKGPGPDPEEPIVEPNPPLVTWTKKEGVLEKETTHATPPVHTESYDIEQIQAQIDKIDAAILKWQGKRKPLQDQIDLYNEL